MNHSGFSKVAGILLLIIASVAFSVPAASQIPRPSDMDALVSAMERLSLNI
jgi:hypothetical protein